MAAPPARGCPRWPETLRLLSSQGELVRGRCASTNQCDYCARLAAVENAELLALDALEGDAPQLWVVLTTRTVTLDMSRFYRSRELVLRALRRRWPAAEVASLLEYTTGYGPRAGGARRPHWNLLLKGVPAADVDQVRDVVLGVWCSREDALPRGQWVDTVRETGGLMRYLALHFQKESQKPPAGFKGHRFVMSRGYLTNTTTPEARERARASLRRRRELWRAHRRGLAGDDALASAAAAIALAEDTTWRVIAVDPVVHQDRQDVRVTAGAPDAGRALVARPGVDGAALPPPSEARPQETPGAPRPGLGGGPLRGTPSPDRAAPGVPLRPRRRRLGEDDHDDPASPLRPPPSVPT